MNRFAPAAGAGGAAAQREEADVPRPVAARYAQSAALKKFA